MRKRQIIEGTVIRRDFPNKGIVSDLIKVSADDAVENEKMEGNCVIKNTLPGQRVRGIVTKSGKNRLEARLLEVLEEAPDRKSMSAFWHMRNLPLSVYDLREGTCP